MFLISTRNFPPDIGGMQNLMEGLSNAILNHDPVQVFDDSFEDNEKSMRLFAEEVMPQFISSS